MTHRTVVLKNVTLADHVLLLGYAIKVQDTVLTLVLADTITQWFFPLWLHYFGGKRSGRLLLLWWDVRNVDVNRAPREKQCEHYHEPGESIHDYSLY